MIETPEEFVVRIARSLDCKLYCDEQTSESVDFIRARDRAVALAVLDELSAMDDAHYPSRAVIRAKLRRRIEAGELP